MTTAKAPKVPSYLFIPTWYQAMYCAAANTAHAYLDRTDDDHIREDGETEVVILLEGASRAIEALNASGAADYVPNEKERTALWRFLVNTVEPSAALMMAGIRLPRDELPPVSEIADSIGLRDDDKSHEDTPSTVDTSGPPRDELLRLLDHAPPTSWDLLRFVTRQAPSMSPRARYNLACFHSLLLEQLEQVMVAPRPIGTPQGDAPQRNAELHDVRRRIEQKTLAILRDALARIDLLSRVQLVSAMSTDPTLNAIRRRRKGEFFRLVDDYQTPRVDSLPRMGETQDPGLGF